MTDDVWGRTFHRARDAVGRCPECDEDVYGEPERVVDADGLWAVGFWVLPFDCPECGTPLEVFAPPPKPKPGARRQTRCPWDGRFVRMNPVGRRAVYCSPACRLRVHRRKKRAGG